jgi:hypothetical protein
MARSSSTPSGSSAASQPEDKDDDKGEQRAHASKAGLEAELALDQQ